MKDRGKNGYCTDCGGSSVAQKHVSGKRRPEGKPGVNALHEYQMRVTDRGDGSRKGGLVEQGVQATAGQSNNSSTTRRRKTARTRNL